MGTWFEEFACTQLKAEYQAMTDENLTTAMRAGGMPGYMVDIALKLKNEDWAAYEQDFRIHSYNAYSDAYYWNNKLRSTGGSYMGNPTGIYTKGDEPLYVFVDSDVPANATLYIAGCAGNDLVTSAKQGKMLKKGLNVVEGKENSLFYINKVLTNSTIYGYTVDSIQLCNEHRIYLVLRQMINTLDDRRIFAMIRALWVPDSSTGKGLEIISL